MQGDIKMSKLASCGGCGAQSRDTGSPIKVLGSGCHPHGKG